MRISSCTYEEEETEMLRSQNEAFVRELQEEEDEV